MRISDWSSDVCSSDLVDHEAAAANLDLGGHLVAVAEVLDVGANDAAARDDEALEATGLADLVVGGEGDVEGGVVGERVHEDEQLAGAPAGDAPRERPAGRGGGAARCGRSTEVTADLVLDRDLAAVDLDDRAHELDRKSTRLNSSH